MINFEKILVITGHYGCGKTNIAVNMALSLAEKGEQVTIVDLDIVNPYFRTNDCRELLEKSGIDLLSANFASTNLDVPSLPGSISGRLRTGKGTCILDVGGDDAGAIALGQYATLISEKGYEMLYVYNPFRFLTATPEETVESLRGIETASRLKVTGLVNNANLGPLTTSETVAKGIPFGKQLTELTGIPVKFTTCTKENGQQINGTDIFPMELYLKPVE